MLWCWVGLWIPSHSRLCINGPSEPGCLTGGCVCQWVKAGGSTICGEIHKLIFSIWDKEELPEEWKESIIVPMYRKGDKTDWNNYRGISLLPTTYKILSNILLSRIISYAEETTGDYQCGFRRNRSTIDHIFCIRRILEKKWEYNEAVHQFFIDFEKAFDSVRREI